MQRKHSTRVTIPRSVVKTEAQRMAKAILKKEKEKEKLALRRAKLRDKARGAKTRQKKVKKAQEEYLDSPFRRELVGIVIMGLGVLLLGVFASDASASSTLETWLAEAFGWGRWVLAFGAIFLGGHLLIRPKEHIFPPVVAIGLGIVFLSLLGIVNMAVPLADSLALSSKFGGAVGFTVGFFFREYFGDFVATLSLLFLLWVGAKLAFNLKFSTIKSAIAAMMTGHVLPTEKPIRKRKSGAVNANPDDDLEEVYADLEEKDSKTGRFINELKIVDSTGQVSSMNMKKFEKKKPEIDPLTAAKDQKVTGVWVPPNIEILKDMPATVVVDEAELRAEAEIIREKLEQFGINVTMKSVHVGPTVTQFTLQPAAGVKLTKITALKNDLALALAASTLRIEAPIRGKSLVGIEIPNAKRSTVGMKEIIASDQFAEMKSPLKLTIGRNVAGLPVVADLAKMPHLLIAGKTGSGKSVAMNAFICSLLWNNAPDKLKMIMIDPKRVELSLYNHLPHLLTPVIVEPEKSVSALAWAVAEMNRRYKKFADARVRNISEYNEKFKNTEEGQEPYIVIVIDELADLMMVAGKDVEAAICRIAQMARAVGMHLMIATQRPSVDVVTGLIKANLPTRIACKVSSGIDSRTIIDKVGAEDLLGFGDMLYLNGNNGDITRIQGLYISNEEIERIVNHIKLSFPEMVMNDEITKQSIEGMAKGGVLTAGVGNEIKDEDLDDRYLEAVGLILETGKASASFMQRRMEIGYARAARILDQMEKKGVIGPSRGAKPREIYGP